MKIKDIHKAKWNPRKMSQVSKEALNASMDEFDDIAGITVNKRTGNLVSGNHRFTELSIKHGKGNISLEHLKGEFYCLNALGEFTGFLVRVVDWDIAKEQAANITANSDLVSGEFTSNLQTVLEEASKGLPDELFSKLRLEDLRIDFGCDDEYLDLDDNLDTIQRESERKNRELENAKGEEAGHVSEIRSLIKVSTPSELKDEVKNDLMEFLSKQKYYNDITIV
jgi:hypothetical protein